MANANAIDSSKLTYTEKSIRTLKGLESVRLRPTKFFADREMEGQLHAQKEAFDNANDEAMLLNDKGMVVVVFFRDYERSTYQVLVIDNGRGVPLGGNTMLRSFTVLDTSGKYDASSYKFSSGTYGVGIKATAGTSEHFRVISVKNEAKGSIYVHKGKTPDELELSKVPSDTTGTYVLFEHDEEIFDKISDYADEGLSKIVDLYNLYNIFTNYRIIIKESSIGVPASVWTAPIEDALDEIKRLVDSSNTVMDNLEQNITLDTYVRDHFSIMRPWAWEEELHLPITSDAKMAYQIFLKYVKTETIGGCLSMVNTVPMSDMTSHHITECQKCICLKLSEHIADKAIKNFVVNNYKLPLFMCIDVKYEGAEFVGAHKSGFKDGDFRKLYGKSVMKQLDMVDPDKIKALYELLQVDIDNKFNVFTTGAAIVKNDNKMLLNLNWPEKFSACKTKDRSKAELFISEGGSASSNEDRDPEYQATYSIRGKPFNGVISSDKVSESKLAILANDIFKDIVAITGLTSTMTDFSELKYGKVFINVDADPHGKHIANILIGNFYILNPAFVASGILHIVTPPFYALMSKGTKKKKEDPIFARTQEDLTNILAKYLYYDAFDIGIKAHNVFDGIRTLDHLEFVQFIRVVMYIGNALERLSKEHVIDPIILEQLTYVSYYLTPETMDVEYLNSVLGYDEMQYDKDNNLLTISIGRKDIPISLYAIADTMYREVIPFLNKIAWKEFTIHLTSKKIDYYKEEQVSYVQLYKILRSLDSMFKIVRFKGLGNMNPRDKAMTCMNPKFRKALRVTSIGDVSTIFQLLGKDSSYRKKLLEYREV